MARTLKSDKVLFWAALALVCTSVVMVVSATPNSELRTAEATRIGGPVVLCS
jgi:cell division protein FtsW (lipid II flippase)